MFGTIKNWLGIEGLKIEFAVEDVIKPIGDQIEGSLLFYSKREQLVESVEIKLIERYSRGRRKNKLINEYTLGEMEYANRIEVPAEQFIELEFALPFQLMKSDMDKYSDLNFVTRSLVEVAKKIKNAKSEFRLEASARVSGTAVHPFVKKIIYME
jgi:hypothetical protein